MAAKKQKEETQSEQSEGLTSQELLKSLLADKDHAESHFQGKYTAPYLVSTGSLKLDRKLDGGLPPGMHRFCGISEGGKSSESLEVMRNFLLAPKRKGFYVDAEGKLTPNVQTRSGVKLVFTEEEWVEGTCFVFKCNIFETVGYYLKTLILNNSEGLTYAFILDSLDAMVSKEDAGKELSEADKIAFNARAMSSLFRRLNLPIGAGSHLCIVISQVRSKPKINQYEKTSPGGSFGEFSGGHAAVHYANFILVFLERNAGDYIYENNEAKEPDKRGKTLGKLTKVRIAKSTNETSGDIVTYPIRHGRTSGNSIWREREIVDELLVRAILLKSGGWYSLVDFILDELKRHGLENIPEKFQGLAKWYEHIEKDKPLADFLYHYLSN